MLEVAVPAFSQEGSEPDRGYTLFKVEVLVNGRKHVVKKRYSEFYTLNKKLKKVIQTPEFPSKHVRNWIPKVMEQRRQGLDNYLQGLICQGGEVPKPLLEFLGIRHLPSMLKTESLDSLDVYPEDTKLSHQPILGFSRDPYVFGTVTDGLPNIVVEGVLRGLYGDNWRYPVSTPSLDVRHCYGSGNTDSGF
uniref:sorting nexin-24 isoform X2 n=1 Tax=Myxine glutinosa TaxID=7769 RepID=UPI00358FBFBF